MKIEATILRLINKKKVEVEYIMIPEDKLYGSYIEIVDINEKIHKIVLN